MACQSGALHTPPAAAPSATLPDASATSHVEASSMPVPSTPEPTLPPTLVSPASLPPTFTRAVPLGALARLGQGTLDRVRPSPDGGYLAVGGSIGVTVYDTEKYEQVWFRRTPAMVKQLEWSPNGEQIAAGLDDEAVIVWNASNGAQVFKVERGGGNSLDWSPDSTRLITGAYDSNTFVWDAATGAQLRQIDAMDIPDNPPSDADLTFAALSPNGKLLATTYQIFTGIDVGTNNVGRIDIWDAHTGEYLRTLEGYTSLQVAWSQNNRLVAAAQPGGLVIWDVESGGIAANLPADDLDGFWLERIVFSPDTQWIAASDLHGNTAVFSVETGDQLPPVGGDRRFVDWSSDGTRYAVLEDDRLVIRDTPSGTEIRRFSGIGKMAGLSLDWATFYGWIETETNASYSWFGTANGTLAAWNMETDRQHTIIMADTRWVQSVAWSPDGTRLATGSVDLTGSSVVIWNAKTGEPAQGINLQTEATKMRTHVTWSPDGNTLAAGTGGNNQTSIVGGVTLLDADSGQTIGTLATGRVESLAWSPDGTMIVVGAMIVEGGKNTSLGIWDVRDGALLRHLEGHLVDHWGTGRVLAVDWSADGAMIASVGSDGQVILWDALTGEQLRVLGTDEVSDAGSVEEYDVAFSPNGSLLAVTLQDLSYTAENMHISHDFVTVWDVQTGMFRYKVQGAKQQKVGPRSGITSVAWSPDGTKLAAASGFPQDQLFNIAFWLGGPSLVEVWDVATGKLLHEFEGHTSDVQSVAFSPDGSLLASGSLDGTVILWDVSQ